MEEKKEPIKVRLSTVILIILIFILFIALVGVIYYYQNKMANNQINLETNKVNTSNQEVEEKNIEVNTIDINTKQVQNLYNEILKSNVIYGGEAWDESFYKDTKVTYNQLINTERIIAVLQAIKDNPTSSINTKSIDKSKLCYKDEVEIDSTAKVYSNQLLEATAQKLFGEQNQNIQWQTMDNNFGFIYDYIDEQYYAYGYQGGGFGCPVRACSKLLRAEEDEENIYLYDEFIFVENTPINTYYYTSSSKKNLIAEVNSYEELDKETVLSKYSGKANQYKHTFKKNTDGIYYWYSTEPIE